jgi:gamma-glutamyltranspeptidase
MAKLDEFAGEKLARSPVYGTKHMVVSGHSLASTAGVKTLEAGGSLIDAMIVTSSVLCTVLPHATSFGGDAFIIYHDGKSGETIGLNASGHAPAGATPEFFKNGMVMRGPLAVSVPGIVRGWERIHQRYGKMDWPDLFKTALDLAENGHPLSRVLASALHLFHKDVSVDTGCSELYMPNRTPMTAGQLIKQPALANTIRTIAKGGSPAYYEGEIAASIGSYSQHSGGLLSETDFHGYEPEWVEVLSTDYRGHKVCVMPPNSYGYLMLMQLNALSGLTSDQLVGPDPERLAYLMTAARVAFDEGKRFICDPAIHPAPIDRLLGQEITNRMRAEVSDPQPGKHQTPGKAGTSCIAMVDNEGNACAVVQSVFHVFGSAWLDPNTGILMNNRMTGFDVDPTHRNVVAPGKRPSHTLNPVMVFKDGKVKYLMTTPGGPAQTISNVQMLTNLVDRGLELSAALEAPRWSIDGAGNALIDDEYPQATIDALEKRGFPVQRASGASYFGSSKCIEVMEDGVFAGAADHRREAYACGY